MRECYTRPHFELGSQAFQRRWYFVLRHGRVGRCQAIILLNIFITVMAGFICSNLEKFYLNKGFRLSENDNLVGGEHDNLDLNSINFLSNWLREFKWINKNNERNVCSLSYPLIIIMRVPHHSHQRQYFQIMLLDLYQ